MASMNSVKQSGVSPHRREAVDQGQSMPRKSARIGVNGQ